MISIKNFTKSRFSISKSTFFDIKKEILPEDYELSLVFVGDQRSRTLNIRYRNKNYIPNVLSFPIDNLNGEIFINLNQLKKETAKFKMDYKNLILLMFIHGCLHLSGVDHGTKMDALENKFRTKFIKLEN